MLARPMPPTVKSLLSSVISDLSNRNASSRKVRESELDHWIIVDFFGQEERWSEGSSDHSLILGTEVGLAALERGIIGS